MFNLKDPKVLHILETILWSFIWMVVALAWNGFINSILTSLMDKMAFLWIIWYLIYAVVITILAVFAVTSYVHFIWKVKKEKDR